jgi:hypothetical protein
MKRKSKQRKILIILLAVLTLAGVAFIATLQHHAASYRFRRSFEAFDPIVEDVSGIRDFFPQEFFSNEDNAALYISEIDQIVHKQGQNIDRLSSAVVQHTDEIIELLHKVALCDHCDFLRAGLPPPRPLEDRPDKALMTIRMTHVARTLLRQAADLAQTDEDKAREIMIYLLSLAEHFRGQGIYCDRFPQYIIQQRVCKALAELTQDSDPTESKTWSALAEKAQQLNDMHHWKGHQMLGRWHATINQSVRCEVDDMFIGAMARCARDSNDIGLRLLAIDGLTAVCKLKWWSFPGRQAKQVLRKLADNKECELLATYARESLALPRAKVKKQYRVYSTHPSYFEKEVLNWQWAPAPPTECP